MAGMFLTISVLLWLWRTFQRSWAMGMGTHLAWAYASAIWLFLVLDLFVPSWSVVKRGCSLRNLLIWTGLEFLTEIWEFVL